MPAITKAEHHRDTDPPDRGFIYGTKEILKYLRIAESTMYRWRHNHALPISKAPDGSLVTSVAILDQWLLSRVDSGPIAEAASGRDKTE